MAKEYEIQVIPTVQAALDQLTVDILKGLLNLLPCESKATRKADIVSVIAQHLQGEKLKALWRHWTKRKSRPSQKQYILKTDFIMGAVSKPSTASRRCLEPRPTDGAKRSLRYCAC